ncbi:MAG: biopolymer transporter ExbD [Bacteroidota bacterium]
MGLKKRNKTSAEFSMSSLTDIIFLLLIFFMLTSSLVAPNALNLKLPGSSSNRPSSTSKLSDVTITRSGRFQLDGKTVSSSRLESALKSLARREGKDASITISPTKGVAVEHVVQVMDIAMRYKINAILATDVE